MNSSTKAAPSPSSPAIARKPPAPSTKSRSAPSRRQLAYFRELVDRKKTVLATIARPGQAHRRAESEIEATLDRAELEDLYLPYKPKRRTKATIAREKGLEPLADYLWTQQPAPQTLAQLAPAFVNEEKGIATPEAALEGARHIVAERIVGRRRPAQAPPPVDLRRRRRHQPPRHRRR